MQSVADRVLVPTNIVPKTVFEQFRVVLANSPPFRRVGLTFPDSRQGRVRSGQLNECIALKASFENPPSVSSLDKR